MLNKNKRILIGAGAVVGTAGIVTAIAVPLALRNNDDGVQAPLVYKSTDTEGKKVTDAVQSLITPLAELSGKTPVVTEVKVDGNEMTVSGTTATARRKRAAAATPAHTFVVVLDITDKADTKVKSVTVDAAPITVTTTTIDVTTVDAEIKKVEEIKELTEVSKKVVVSIAAGKETNAVGTAEADFDFPATIQGYSVSFKRAEAKVGAANTSVVTLTIEKTGSTTGVDLDFEVEVSGFGQSSTGTGTGSTGGTGTGSTGGTGTGGTVVTPAGWSPSIPAGPYYVLASNNGEYTTVEANGQGHVAAHAGATKVPPTPTAAGESITVVKMDGSEAVIQSTSGQTTWVNAPTGPIYTSTTSGEYTTHKASAANYQAHEVAVQGKYTFTVGSKSYTVVGASDGTTNMADATGVTVAITGGNALVNTPATPSTITLDAAGTGVGIASATGTASGYVAPGPVVTTVVQNTAPKQAVPHAAVPGSIGITVADTDLTADVTTGTATDYVANGPIASTDVIVAQSTAPVPSPDGGATPATPGEWTITVHGVTFTITGKADGSTLIGDINTIAGTATATGSTPASTDAAVAGSWTVTASGATFTVTGKSDGTTTKTIVDGLVATASAGAAAVNTPATDSTVTVTLPAGITLSSDSATNSLTFTQAYSTSAPAVTAFNEETAAKTDVPESIPTPVSMDTLKAAAASAGASGVTIDSVIHTTTTSIGYDWSSFGPEPSHLFELKTDHTKYTVDETKATDYVAAASATPVVEATLQAAGTVVIDGTSYTYTPASSSSSSRVEAIYA